MNRCKLAIQWTLAVFSLCWVAAVSATQVFWNSGFSGFSPGEVYFASTVEFSTTGLDRGTTLFRYSPANDELHEVRRLFGTGVSRYLAFDAAGLGLYIGDTDRIQLLKPSGNLVDVWNPAETILDINTGSDGALYVAIGNGVSRFNGASGDTVASVGTSVRGVAVRPDGTLILGIDKNELLYQDDNLLTVNPSGDIGSRKQVGMSGVGLVRNLSGDTIVAVSQQRTTLASVNLLGGVSTIADGSDGVFQTDGIAVDELGRVWVTTRGRPATLQQFSVSGDRLVAVSLELSALVGSGERGFFSPSGVAVAPVPTPAGAILLGTALLGLSTRIRRSPMV